MADTPFTIKQNDTRPVYVATLLENFGTPQEAPVDLTDATSVKFLMRAIAATDPAAPQVSDTMDIDDALEGIVSYTWQTGDTDTVGSYYTEIEVTWNDGGVQSFPSTGYGAVVVTDDLG